jgi:DNA (cytosine-5)-methyltransferase 1
MANVALFTMLKFIDLFCGCGGMTLGFVQTGQFTQVFANDFNGPALDSYRANFDQMENHSQGGDITALLNTPENFPAANVVIGGPPCQGFSTLNKNRDSDQRKSLWRQFLTVAALYQAQVIVMENVPQLLSSPEFFQIEDELARLGFPHVCSAVLNAADYGVPQIRRRAVIIASKKRSIPLPKPTHANPLKSETSLKSWTTVREAIGDLPEPTGTELCVFPPPLDLHIARTPTPISYERYCAVPAGGNRFDLQKNRPDITPACWLNKPSGSTDIFGRLWWDRPSVTIRTEFFKPEKGRYLHPQQNRPITLREAARLQSFPDNFIFRGSKAEIARQIGNAVPPLLARAIAEEVIRAF